MNDTVIHLLRVAEIESLNAYLHDESAEDADYERSHAYARGIRHARVLLGDVAEPLCNGYYYWSEDV